MATEVELPVEERIFQLLQTLGIERAHFGAAAQEDLAGFLKSHEDRIISLAIVSPDSFDPDVLRPVESRLLVVTGDEGPHFRLAHAGIPNLPKAKHVALRGYYDAGFTDMVADRMEEVGLAIADFLLQFEQQGKTGKVDLCEGSGEVAGITYRIRGAGPPLLLFPIGLKPSQWEPIIAMFAERYCTVTLGGAYIGAVRNLETRARVGYRALVRSLVAELQLNDGETVLDVGCGSGAHDRFLVQLTSRQNPVTGVDHSPYMVREAKDIARSEGLEGVITFEEGNAEALPFPDNSFDAVMSVTVMEEVNADKMVAELFRVARSGGRVGVVVRSLDMPWLVNLPISNAVKQKVEAPGVMGGGLIVGGCADAGLYRHFSRVGLSRLKMFPQLVAFKQGPLQRFQTQALAVLTDEEAEEWRTAVAESEGTFFIAQPFHCVVGTKP